MQSCCGGSSRFSGQIRLMRRPELVTTRRSTAAAAVGFEELEREREVERSKRSEDGERGIYRGSEKLFVRRFRMNVPLTILLLTTCVTHVLCGGDRVRSWVNRIMHRGMRNSLSGKTENLDKICFISFVRNFFSCQGHSEDFE